MKNRIFSVDNAKASKAAEFGYLNAIHYMAPADLSGWNLCPKASNGCKALCLGWTSGHAGMVKADDQINAVRQSRIDKATRFMTDRQAYLADVIKAIDAVKRQAKRYNLIPCVRLNGSTDIAWEGIRLADYEGMTIFELFPNVQFVDYTKNKRRALNHAAGKLPKNYHLTFSRSETNEDDCETVLAHGGNVAVVFGKALPTLWKGAKVLDGDAHDLRHLDFKADPAAGDLGYVIGLLPKGSKAKKDTSGFVVW